jgi:predicted CopG family antitoxin
MTNITLSIPEDLHSRMKKHSEIRWSEVIRKTISEKLDNLELMDKICGKSRLSEDDIKELSLKIDGAVSKKLGLR